VASVIFEEAVAVPLGLTGLADFRRWSAAPEFPETGRIDFLAGTIEVDMSPEDIFCHGVLKAEVAAVLQRRIKDLALGCGYRLESRGNALGGQDFDLVAG